MIVAASASEKVAAANAVFVSDGVSAQLSVPKLRIVEPDVDQLRKAYAAAECCFRH